jgi:hypothetical protein
VEAAEPQAMVQLVELEALEALKMELLPRAVLEVQQGLEGLLAELVE